MKRGKVYGKSEEGDWQYDCCVPGGRNERFFLPLPWAACLLGSSSFDGSVNNPDKSERD